jgi:YfiH family protein
MASGGIAITLPPGNLGGVLTRRCTTSNLVWYESPLLAAAGVPHGFSTRLGGVSVGPFTSLNFGNPGGFELRDDLEAIAENHRRLQEAIGASGRHVLRVHQVHGNRVIDAGDGCAWDNSAQADAIIATHPGQLASVRTADCVPILLATDDGRAVAAVHAGWRGVVAGAVANAIARLRIVRQGRGIIAAIGPCIGMEAFEVGLEVLEAFATLLGDLAPIRRRADGKGHVDLRRAVALQLQANGVSDDHIDATDQCTVRDAAEFFSHRRDAG